MKPLIHGMSREELHNLCAETGEPRYRGDQIWRWLYATRAHSWEEMLNLPRAMRDRLADLMDIVPVRVRMVSGRPNRTRKLLVRLRDGENIEQVLIPAANRRTVCVSTQAGCRFNCAFCASGKSGFRRNMEPGEIVGQVLAAADAWSGSVPPVTHVVFMGVGEPFDNYDNVLKSIRIINDESGLNIGARRITVSTCGLVPEITRFGGEGLQVELSVSLHAPNDGLRTGLMPVNRRYPLADLMKCCREYVERTGRIVTFEYALVRGINDTPAHMAELAALLRPMKCRVNLIPLSPVEEFAGAPSPDTVIRQFVGTLAEAGINATVRASRGTALAAACGQLRAESAKRKT